MSPAPGDAHGDLRRALRGSIIGCAYRDVAGLTRREQEACDETLGRGAAEARFIDPPMDPAKRAGFAARARAKEIVRKRKEGAVPPGVDPVDNAGGTKTSGVGLKGD